MLIWHGFMSNDTRYPFTSITYAKLAQWLSVVKLTKSEALQSILCLTKWNYCINNFYFSTVIYRHDCCSLYRQKASDHFLNLKWSFAPGLQRTQRSVFNVSLTTKLGLSCDNPDRGFAKRKSTGRIGWRAKKPAHRGRLNLMPKIWRLTTHEKSPIAAILLHPFPLACIFEWQRKIHCSLRPLRLCGKR